MNHRLKRTLCLATLILSMSNTAMPIIQVSASTLSTTTEQSVTSGNKDKNGNLGISSLNGSDTTSIPNASQSKTPVPIKYGVPLHHDLPNAPKDGQPGSRIKLDGTDYARMNTRDLGGYKTSDGKWQIKPKRLIRSANLSTLDDKDISLFKNVYHVSSVIDFRTPGQVKKGPDKIIPGAKIQYLSVLGPHAYADNGDGDFYNQRLNFGSAAVTGYTTFLNGLINRSGATIFHCSSGKDRTGIATILIMAALGIDQETQINDYLLSQVYSHPVQYAWLFKYLTQINQNYGSMDNYMTQVLDFGPDKRALLKSQYLVSTDGKNTAYPAPITSTSPVPTPAKPIEKPVTNEKPVTDQVDTSKPEGVVKPDKHRTTHTKVKIISVKKIKKIELVHLKGHRAYFYDMNLKYKVGKSGKTGIHPKAKWKVLKEAKIKVNGKIKTYVQVKSPHGYHRWILLKDITRIK